MTKNIFSSWKALHPSWYCHFRRLGGEQTAVGGAFNYRQEIFRRATVFQIRCLPQRASPILNFRTEQFRKGESASPAAWSPVRKWGEIFVMKARDDISSRAQKFFVKAHRGGLAVLWPSPPLWVLCAIGSYLLISKPLLSLAKVSETVYPSAFSAVKE